MLHAVSSRLTPKTCQSVSVLLAPQFGRQWRAERKDVVIVGGGLTGITAAWLAKNDPNYQDVGDVLLLEGKPDFGGNAKSAVIPDTGQAYPQGASIWTPGSPKEFELMAKLGIDLENPAYQIRPDKAYVKTPTGYRWLLIEAADLSQITDPFERDFIASINWIHEEMIRDIGSQNPNPIQFATEKQLLLDTESFAAYLVGKLFALPTLVNSPYAQLLKEAVQDFFEEEVRSDLGSDTASVSALGAVMDSVENGSRRFLFPGGNWFVGKKMIEDIVSDPTDRVTIKRNHPVTEVKPGRRRVKISYLDPDGEKHQVKAKRVLLSVPPKQAITVMPSIQPIQKEILENLKRGSYILMNLFLDPEKPLPLDANTYHLLTRSEWLSDVVLTHDVSDSPKRLNAGAYTKQSVMTCYIPIPLAQQKQVNWQGTETELKKIAASVIADLEGAFPGIQAAIKAPPEMNYYAEGMLAAAPGQMKQLKNLNPLLDKRVYWSHSDTCGLPVVTGAINAAFQGMDWVLRSLQSEPIPKQYISKLFNRFIKKAS